MNRRNSFHTYPLSPRSLPLGKVRTVAAILCCLLSGCLSRQSTIVVPPIHVTVDAIPSRSPGENPIPTALVQAMFGPETAIEQMAAGCGYFYGRHGRWPRTKEEVAAGLNGANLSSAKLAHLEELELREDGSALVINFISTENGRVQGTLTLAPKSNRSSGQTRGPGLRFRRARGRSPRPFHPKKTASAELRAAHL